jgi:tetratricopeptide (TPR) repeat protein
MVRALLTLGLALAVACVQTHSCFAQAPSANDAAPLLDPFDPFDVFGSDGLSAPQDDKDKSASELISEATLLLTTDRLLDARTKLLKALSKDPSDYRAHQLLGGYYLVHVGHFRLALKYIKRALELFTQKNGTPPYLTERLRTEHSSLLYYLSQARLNLDDYAGSLKTLDQFTGYGYYSDWYPGTRAWVLMKMGNLQEAIRVARMGVLAGAEQGRILNMLGILLSMNDQPQEALDVFRKAIATEMALGNQGQPATPLNNAGEVYRELFEDEKAESSFLRALSLPDSCEHVLPTLNVVLLYIEQTKFEAAASAIDNFEKCIAQFPLRNNEEHAALVALARGRVDLHTGRVERAIARFETALDGTQWFGKIGTNQNDLLVAATISLAQALTAQNAILTSRIPITWGEWLATKKTLSSNAVRAWWLLRRARQMLLNDLNDVEDLIIRNTDSLIEYPTFGDALYGLSRVALARRLEKQRVKDTRGPAQLFYDTYFAQSSLGWLHRSEGLKLLEGVTERARPQRDELLRVQAMLLRLGVASPSTPLYRDLAYRVFQTAPAALRNHGVKLPIRFDNTPLTSTVRNTILRGPFVESASGTGGDLCTISATQGSTSPDAISLRFTCPGNAAKNRSTEDSDINQVVNKLSDALFTEEITNGRKP